MANTITLTTAGKIAHETFAGQTDGAGATMTDLTLTAPASYPWLVATYGSVKCMITNTGGGAYDYFAHGFATGSLDLSKILIQRRESHNNVAAWSRAFFSGAAGSIQHAWLENQYYGVGGFANNGIINAQAPMPWTRANNVWLSIQDYFEDDNHYFILWGPEGKRVQYHGASGNSTWYTGAGLKGVYYQANSPNPTIRVADIVVCTDKILTVTGLAANMGVRLLDASDNVLFSICVNGASATLELIGNILPISAKFQVLGTDGSELLKTGVQTIYGGDIWAYDGATSGGGTPPPARVEVLSFENLNTGTSGKITFTTTDATAYRIYRAERPFEAFTLAATVTTGEHTFTDLTTQTEYQFYIVGTNDGGNALPSDVIQGLVYGQEFNYLANTAETVKTLIELNFPQFRTVHIGEKQIMPNQIPSIFIIPVDESPGDFAHLSGQYDIKYRFNIRVYSQGASANSESILDNQKLLGKLKLQLEAIKNYHPYWYYSEVEQTTFDNLDTDKQLKYSELTFMTTRRIPRKY